MDRAIPSEQLNKQRARTYIAAALLIAVAAFGFTEFKRLLKPSIRESALTVSRAEVGHVEATIPASGIIIPNYEVLITSPVNASIEKIHHSTGETVDAGELIMALNKEALLTMFEKLNEEQQVNRNKIHQLELSLQKSLNELETQYSIKDIRIKSLETALAHEQSLLSIGGSTEESVKQVRLNLHIAQLELKELKNQISNQRATMQADLKSLGYEISIREKDIREISNKLEKANVSSPQKGVILWINNKIGAEVSEGTELVRIADLSNYRVEASVSDNYAKDVKPGRTAIVRIDKTDLRGRVMSVEPAVDNGTVKFSISLDNQNTFQLRPNLKADIFIITSRREKTIRLQNGPAFTGSDEQTVFVLENKTAVARKVNIGESNSDYVEILSGIKPGEKVITSDMQEFVHLKSIEVN